MFAFLSQIFSKKPAKSCCGSGKCHQKVSLEVSESDLAQLRNIDTKIVVGKILKIENHPDPKITKVRVTQCDLGKGVVEQILCGGKNITENQIVPVAMVGTTLGKDFVIGERDIRGTISRGMICSREELEIAPIAAESGGIWVLPESLASLLGTPLNKLV